MKPKSPAMELKSPAMDADTPALAALADSGLSYRVLRFPPPGSVVESAAAQGIPPESLLKTIVVRRGEDDYVFVLVPGTRVIDWAKLRAVLAVRRLAMPDAAEALAATGYERGAVTPFGARHPWPVIADALVPGLKPAGIGGGRLGVAVHLPGADLVARLGASVADVTKPAG
jgi:Cys-tRNA(Pro) deacylase